MCDTINFQIVNLDKVKPLVQILSDHNLVRRFPGKEDYFTPDDYDEVIVSPEAFHTHSEYGYIYMVVEIDTQIKSNGSSSCFCDKFEDIHKEGLCKAIEYAYGDIYHIVNDCMWISVLPVPIP